MEIFFSKSFLRPSYFRRVYYIYVCKQGIYLMAAIILQDASGPFLYGTLNRRPQMTLPRPRSDRLGSEGSSIMNGHHHHHLMGEAAHLTTSISAYNNQDVWTPIQTHRYVCSVVLILLRIISASRLKRKPRYVR